LNFYSPVPGKDGKSIFAIGVQARGQLLRYDAASRQYAPYLLGASLDELAFSRDGQWMAFIEYPQGILVRSRVEEWGLDPARVGVMGFSAGGHAIRCGHCQHKRSD